MTNSTCKHGRPVFAFCNDCCNEWAKPEGEKPPHDLSEYACEHGVLATMTCLRCAENQPRRLYPKAGKPPIGVKPRDHHVRGRYQDILKAIQDYSAERVPIPEEWGTELIETTKWLMEYTDDFK